MFDNFSWGVLLNHFDNNTQSQTSINASYKDGLGLIKFNANASNKQTQKTSDQTWDASLGIITLDENGKQLWTHGNVLSCNNFIKQNPEIDFSKNSISVELFCDDLIIISSLNDSYRLISIDPASARDMLRDVFPDFELSNAELRVLLQLLSGLTLKEAAKNDGVSYETKRTQFKSLSMRTGFNSQGEVIRNTLLVLNAHILQGVSQSQEHRSESVDIEQKFLDRYYNSIFRYHKISTHTGRVIRVLETGPVSGKPVVFAHSQTLPPPSQFRRQFGADWLSQNDIRLFIPLRDGMLEEKTYTNSTHDHVTNSTADLVSTIEIFCGGKAKVVAQSSGVAYSVNLAKARPDLISKLTLSASAYLGQYENTLVEKFVKSFFNIAVHNHFILEQVYSKYLNKMGTKNGLLSILQSAYKKSAKDMEVFNFIVSTDQGYSWMRESYELSKYSVINDVLLGSQNVWEGAEKIKTEVMFLHGKNDPINSANNARMIQKRFANSGFVLLVDEGQSLFLNRFSDIVSKSLQEWQ